MGCRYLFPDEGYILIKTFNDSRSTRVFVFCIKTIYFVKISSGNSFKMWIRQRPVVKKYTEYDFDECPMTLTPETIGDTKDGIVYIYNIYV